MFKNEALLLQVKLSFSCYLCKCFRIHLNSGKQPFFSLKEKVVIDEALTFYFELLGWGLRLL